MYGLLREPPSQHICPVALLNVGATPCGCPGMLILLKKMSLRAQRGNLRLSFESMGFFVTLPSE
jgi:hypothetical protein